MKTSGLIGGMSWESTLLYYQTINREVGRRLGGLHSASIQLVSLDFEDIASRQRADDWDGMREILVRAAQGLQRSGADAVLICTNTMHKLAPEVSAQIEVPLLHIADVTAQAIRSQGLTKIGLLGTRFTMEQPFYTDRLREQGVECVVPDAYERAEVHRIIFEELCKGHMHPGSRAALQRICRSLAERGAEGIVLGCTELPLLLSQDDLPLPVFDTTTLHALAAVDFACSAPVSLESRMQPGELPIAA